MKKSWVMIAVIIALVIAAVVAFLLIGVFRCPTVDFAPELFTDCNYNNYNLLGNTLDYRYGKFAWVDNSCFGSVIAVQSEDGGAFYIRGYRDIAQIQLAEEGIYFLADLGLYFQSYEEDSSAELIAEEIDSFIATGEYVFYGVLMVDTPSPIKPSGYANLMCLNKKTGEHTLFAEDVNFYCIDDDGVYVKTSYSESDVIAYTHEGTYTKAVLKDGAYLSVQCCGDFLAYCNDTSLNYIGENMEDFHAILLCDDGHQYANVAGICDKDLFYISYHAVEHPAVEPMEIDSPSNGLWKIDPKTGEKERLSETTYDELYCFGTYGLFGVRDGEIYKISTEDGTALKISD